MWLNISSTHPNCVNFIRVLAIRGIVVAIVNFSVGREVGQDGVEVGLVSIISCVVAIIVNTVVGSGRLETW